MYKYSIFFLISLELLKSKSLALANVSDRFLSIYLYLFFFRKRKELVLHFIFNYFSNLYMPSTYEVIRNQKIVFIKLRINTSI